MKFNNYPLRNELKEGLLQYERDTNIPLHSLVESLIEKFLIKEEYLIIGAGDEVIPFPTELNEPHLKYTNIRSNGKLRVRKYVNGKLYTYCTCDYKNAKPIITFLESKDWDLKYSASRTKLKGEKQVDFLFNEMEKESELMETE